MPDPEGMSAAEYEATLQQVMLLAQLVSTLDLESFLRSIDQAEALGPLLEPTLYRAAGDNLSNITRIARAAKRFQDEISAVRAWVEQRMGLRSGLREESDSQ